MGREMRMEKILRRIYSAERVSLSLKIISHASSLICAAAYIAMLVFAFIKAPIFAVKLAVAGGVPFVTVTVIGRIINAPRPYELYDFYGKKPKEKAGQSFPSRHVFSAFTVAGLAYTFSVWLTVALSVIGVCIAVSRVLLGMHFIRDVMAGALIGILSGILGIIIIL